MLIVTSSCLRRWAPRGRRPVICINSAALRFIPYDELESRGYGQYKRFFEGANKKEVER